MEYNAYTSGDTFHLDLSGELTAFAHEDFRRLINDAMTQEHKKCTLNLQDLSFIDSGGLGMLLLAKDELEKKQVEMALRRPQGSVQKILKVAKFDQLLTIEE